MLLQVNSARNRCLINPTSDTVVERGDQLIMMRPTCIASHAYKPLKKPVEVDKGKRLATLTIKESYASLSAELGVCKSSANCLPGAMFL